MVFRNLAFVFLIAYAVSGEGDEASDVLVLTDNDLDEALNTHTHLLVEFYAPWCGHCKRLAPEYEKAATLLKDASSKAKIAKVDATVEKQSAGKFEVRGYPTLLYFENGQKVEKYSGARTADAISAYMRKKTGENLADI